MPAKQDKGKLKTAVILLPNQLFFDTAIIEKEDTIYLVEEYLFFHQFKFHKSKLAFHRASMKFYENHLKSLSYDVVYIEASDLLCDLRNLIPRLKAQGVYTFKMYIPEDDWLERRLNVLEKKNNIEVQFYKNLLFLNSRDEIVNYFIHKKRFFQTDFYIDQRKKRNILLEVNNGPIGGKWSFDVENRKKYPKSKPIPNVLAFAENNFDKEAKAYTEKNFKNNPGDYYKYPSTFHEAQVWFQDFLENRFHDFGEYEDAMVSSHSILNHSVLTPVLNVGLLQPMDIIEKAINYANQNNVSINSVEGFVRQILGWREFIRAIYVLKGREQRTRNYWKFSRNMPHSFYEGSTGITPVDNAIRKVLKSAYNHHIERLMVLGNFMLLNEIHPDKVYTWFMEMYIDAYDWVMVPNVYGMSQFSDGGMMATKPYISGSNYIFKMSDFPKENWQFIWDALFWEFLNKHRHFFKSNPRLALLLKTYDNFSEDKKDELKTTYQSWMCKV